MNIRVLHLNTVAIMVLLLLPERCLYANSQVDIEYVPISETAFVANLQRPNINELTMSRMINQGANSGYGIVAYTYFQNRVKQQPNSAKLNLYLSWSAGSFWQFIGYGHSSVLSGSSGQQAVYAERITAIENAWKLDPNSAIIKSDYGATLFFDGRFNNNVGEEAKGLSFMRQAVKSDSSSGYSACCLAMALLEQDFGRNASQETISELQAAARLVPDSSGIHLYLGDAYQMNGDTTNANKEHKIAELLRHDAPIIPMQTAREPGSGWNVGLQKTE